MGTPFVVSPQAFTDAMLTRWKSLGNAPSPRLLQLWTTMAQTLNDAATTSSNADTTWRVLQPPTGSGKTQGLCVYAALAARQNRVDRGQDAASGLYILIVTRTIAQADEIVATTNELAGEAVAVAKHSGNKLSLAAAQAADVLVITHAAYTLALEGVNRAQNGRLDDLTTTACGARRCLTIIDEALAGVIDDSRVTAGDIRQVLSYLDGGMKAHFSAQVGALEAARDTLDKFEARSTTASREDDPYADLNVSTAPTDEMTAEIVWRAVYDGRDVYPQSLRMTSLREAMAPLRYDLMVLRKDSTPDRQRIARRVDDTLKGVEAAMAQWAYYYRKGSDHTFNTAQLLIPVGLPGPVVLDATARQNFLWRLLGDRARLAEIPEGTRNYANVILHVARARGLGKGKMTARGSVRIPRVLDDLERRLSGGDPRKVLLCLHKAVEHVALGYSPEAFDTYSVAHWGAIDGKNDWQDHDTVVILGLPYRDTVWATNAFFALQGLQDNAWLQRPAWGEFEDVRREMLRRQMTVSIIQAINRVRCRRVTDEHGNCAPTDVFIVLPNGADGDAVLDHIVEEMPGMVVENWDSFALDGPAVHSVRRGSAHEAVLSFMANRLPGETSMTVIGTQLGLSKRGLRHLRETLRNDNHPLTMTLAERGMHYLTSGTGRGSKSYIVKAG